LFDKSNCVLALALLSAVTSRAAHADDRERVTARLEWERGPGASTCMDGQRLAEEVERRLRHKVFLWGSAASSADITVRGRVTASPTQDVLVAQLTLERTTDRGIQAIGTREIEAKGPDCTSLEQGLPIVLGLMVDLPRNSALLEPASAASPVAPASPAPPAAPPVLQVEAAPAPEKASRPWTWDLRAGAAGGMGMLPGVSRGARVSVGLQAPSLPAFRIGGTQWMPHHHREGLYGSDVRAWEIDAAVCPAFAETPHIRAGACARAAMGHFYARGIGFDRSSHGEGTLAHLGAGAWVEVPLGGPWSIALDLNAAAPLVRQQFVFYDESSTQQVFFRSPVAAGWAALSVVLRLPAPVPARAIASRRH
jgi:hypothetical protein